MELPFRAPSEFEPLCFTEATVEGHWFVFCGDRLLVELGPLEQPATTRAFARGRLGAAVAEVLSGCPGAHALSGPAARRRLLGGGVRSGRSAARRARLGGPAAAFLGARRRPLRARRARAAAPPMGPHAPVLRTLRHGTLAKREERVRVCPAYNFGLSARGARRHGARSRGKSDPARAQSALSCRHASALAGFVEPGESLEQCLAREVAEEVGVRIGASALLREPELAVSALAHDRVRLRVRRRRIEAASRRRSRTQSGSIYCICRNFRAKSRSLGN